MKKIKILTVWIILMASIFILTSCSSEKPIDGFNIYKESWEDKDYKKMYSMLSKESKEYISEEDFIDRYTNIYNGIAADELNIDINKSQDDKDTVKFTLNMDSLAGEISIDNYKAKMVKEKNDKKDQWLVEWDESLIFPQMEEGDSVKVSIYKAKRGEIYDRSGKGLAINGIRYNVGIHPSKYDESNNSNIADLLDIDEEVIAKELEKSTNPENFVPIVKLSLYDEELLNKLIDIDGVIYYEVDDRVYPGGESAGSLIGYIKSITAEELEKDKDNIYTSTSLVGKFGLEKVYEERLRAIDGKKVYISKIEDGQEVEEIILAETDLKDGEDLNLNIDISLQKKIYEEIDGDIGTANAIDPNTGEVLAMVSSPSFDSNLYTTYISNTQRKKLEDEDGNRFENRFNKVYSPGSTFKILTAAIGLENDIIDSDKRIKIKGKGWQKDSSWGGYKINRVSQDYSNVNLNDAFVSSDNIYFAMAGLDIGGDKFIEGVKKFGLGEELPFKYPMENSKLLNNDKFKNEILIADTGYGQGEILMNPLHLSLIYSSLVNDGNIMKPLLEVNEENEVWKENVMTDKNRNIILNSLINVIEDKNGTGNKAKLNNIKLAGKTGTSELKTSQEGLGKENGWFVAMDVDKPKIAISMMIEDVGDRDRSEHVVPKVRNVLKYYLEDR